MAVSTITSKGQTTIPSEIRRLLKLKAGDRIEFVVEADGKVVLVPATVPVGELEGLLAPAPRKVSVDEMEVAVRRRARSASARPSSVAKAMAGKAARQGR